MSPSTGGDSDPVTARRNRIRELARSGKRAGCLCILAAIVIFAWGFAAGFQQWMTVAVGIAFALSALFMIPATIAAYGVSAAEREEA